MQCVMRMCSEMFAINFEEQAGGLSRARIRGPPEVSQLRLGCLVCTAQCGAMLQVAGCG